MKRLIELKDLIKKNEETVKRYKRKEKIKKANKSKSERKQRVHELIKLGALFEIAGLKKENKGLLLGWLMKLPYITKEEEEIIKKIGQKELDDRVEKNKKH